MILLIGQVASDQRDREAFQEVDYRQMFGPGTVGFAKWVGEMQSADRVPEYVAHAFRAAMQGRPDPSCSSARGHAAQATAAPVIAARGARGRGAGPAGSRGFAPLLRGGAAVRDRRRQRLDAGGVRGACEHFAEGWQLPVGCAFRFQDLFDNRHPNYAGDFGTGTEPALGERLAEPIS